MIKYCKSIKYNKYKWLTYDSFKKLEESTNRASNETMETDVANSLISAINNIYLKDSSLIENKNISENFLLNNNDMINEDFIEIEEDLDSSYEEDSKDNIFEVITSLFCLLLEEERFIKYKDLIKEFIENSKTIKMFLFIWI